MKLSVYEHILAINSGFDQAIRSLAALRKRGRFHAGELDRFIDLAREIRARTNSYVAGIVEQRETAEAGRRFGRRRERENREESGSG